jgi:hypothetical protein
LKLLFNNIDNLWTYLNFHKEKALIVDLPWIEAEHSQLAKDYQAHPNGLYDRTDIDLPISIKLIMLEGIGTQVRVKGDATL